MASHIKYSSQTSDIFCGEAIFTLKMTAAAVQYKWRSFSLAGVIMNLRN
jgi:hypothetical protein